LAIYFFFAVLALVLKAAAVGAPLAPGLRMVSPLPAAMRSRLAWILAYKPGFLATLFTFLAGHEITPDYQASR
jgi:hypothetical protein